MFGPWVWLAAPGTLLWGSVLLAPWQPWRIRERLEASPEDADLADITALIPARNEAGVLGMTLRALRAQGETLHAVLVDDRSTDATAVVAREAFPDRLDLVAGAEMPAGWTGKLWALEQGRPRITTPLTLLLDADIELAPGTVAALRRRLRADGLSLVSLMATLSVGGFWARLLQPAFVYFFKLLYPFALVNSRSRHVAAAAGGCILVETEVLEEIGGFGSLRGALIDDCTLARRVKSGGRGIWIGLSRSARSLRPSHDLRSIWEIIARTAFTQLRRSAARLLVCTILLAIAFLAPPAALFSPDPAARACGALALLAMAASYLPMLRFYRISPAWVLGMPLIGALYGAMTWTSAVRCWRGIGPRWKGRVYPSR